mmetsp:Transcript_12796/g.27600  ORF Transcript_12796/g.27600 Transcript_12796/m.27600 type:complete len:257 (-) Transcript_12796:1111-1881(-)
MTRALQLKATALHYWNDPAILDRTQDVLPRLSVRASARHRPIRLDHPPHRLDKVLLEHPTKPLGSAQLPHELRARIRNPPGLLGMTFGPIELGPQILQTGRHGYVMSPRHESIVDIILRGSHVMEEQAGHGELLDGAAPRGPAPTSKVDVVLVRGKGGWAHAAVDADADRLPLCVLGRVDRRGFAAVEIGGEFDVGPRESISTLSGVQLGVGGKGGSLPAWEQRVVFFHEGAYCIGALVAFFVHGADEIFGGRVNE